jgi:hypothetical protein
LIYLNWANISECVLFVSQKLKSILPTSNTSLTKSQLIFYDKNTTVQLVIHESSQPDHSIENGELENYTPKNHQI